MARTPSTMVPLGSVLPAFALADVVTGATVASASYGARPLLVMFICNHCPYVVHVLDELTRLARDYGDRVDIVAINSNDTDAYPQDGPGPMRELATARGWAFPFCLDATQAVARAFEAACTPDFFLFTSQEGALRLFYRGQLDETRPGGATPHGSDLRAAFDAALSDAAAPADQQPSLGCNIKWRS